MKRVLKALFLHSVFQFYFYFQINRLLIFLNILMKISADCTLAKKKKQYNKLICALYSDKARFLSQSDHARSFQSILQLVSEVI